MRWGCYDSKLPAESWWKEQLDKEIPHYFGDGEISELVNIMLKSTRFWGNHLGTSSFADEGYIWYFPS